MTKTTIKGPAVFLAQFAADTPPYDTLPSLVEWAVGKGFKAVQIPTWDTRLIDLPTAAQSADYCDDLRGTLAEHGLELLGIIVVAAAYGDRRLRHWSLKH